MHGNEIISTGFHFDEFILVDNNSNNGDPIWLFKHRVIRHHWTKSGGFEEVNI